MQSISQKASPIIAAAIALALSGPAAQAQQGMSGSMNSMGSTMTQGFDYALTAGVGNSDNLRRDDGDRVDSMIYSVGTIMRYGRDEGRLRANVNLDLSWQDYEAEGFDSQVYGNVRARARYAFVPERFEWVFENDFGQGNRNPFASNSPDNVENINLFTTGPEWTLRFGQAFGATVDAKYSNVWYEDSPNNSDRYSGGLSLFRSISPTSRAYVRGRYEDVQFDSGALAPDFNQTDVVAGYSIDGARTRLKAEAGYSQLETDVDKQDGPMFRLQLSRDLTEALELSLNAGQEFNDSARDIRSQGDFGDPTNDNLSVARAYKDLYGEGRLRFRKNRTELGFGVRYHEQDYVDASQLNRDDLRFTARLQRQLSRAWRARLDAEFQSVDYRSVDNVDYDETEYGAGIGWQPTPKLTFDLTYRYRTRPSDSVDSFDENRIWLIAEWAPGRAP